MKTITTIILSMLLTFTIATGSKAQNYKKSFGVRLGTTSALTYKYFLEDRQAIEFMISGRGGGIQGTMLYENHAPIQVSFTDNLYFIYGGGGHIGVNRPKRYEKWHGYNPSRYHVSHAIGVDGIIGIEYVWYKVPVTFGFEVKPFIDLVGFRYAHAEFWDSAISIKYIFK